MSHSRHLKYFSPGYSVTFILHAEHSEIHKYMLPFFTVVYHQTRNLFNSFNVRHTLWFHYFPFEWNIIYWVKNFWALVYSWAIIKRFVCVNNYFVIFWWKNMILLFDSIKVMRNGFCDWLTYFKEFWIWNNICNIIANEILGYLSRRINRIIVKYFCFPLKN